MNRSPSDVQLPAQTLEEASDWFVQFRLGDVNAQGREAFNTWLCRSPEHIRAYMQIAQAYADLPALKDKALFNLQDLVARAKNEINIVPLCGVLSTPESVKSTPIAPQSLRRSLLALAAGVTLAVLSLVGYLGYNAYRAPTYATETGEQRSLTLADGSTVALNAQSRVRIRISEHERRIDLLAGQALFQVAKDRNRPFIVHSKGTLIRAVGTQFDVYQRKSGTTVTVLEGRVAIEERKVNNIGGEVFVSAGERLILAPGSAMEPQKTKPAAAIAWTQRRLVFDGTSLPDVVEEFNRYNVRPLVIRGEGFGDFHISGVYSSTDPASLVRFLKAELGLVAREEDGQIVVSRE
jgi:transmembrane sensor